MKKALLIGINYIGHERGVLKGCINDAENLSEMLVSQYGYDPANITILTDNTSKKPTKQHILSALLRMVQEPNLEEIWFSYSGHGTSENSSNEADGKNECLVPIDYQHRGVITDDILHHLFSMVNKDTRVISLIDACHSGSMLDLKYRYQSGLKEVIENKKDYIQSNVVMVSGCMDSQTSADFYNQEARESAGAMTAAFISVLKDHNYNITCYKLLKRLRERLSTRFTQIPQLSCTRKLDDTSIFSLNPDRFVNYMTFHKK